MVIHLYEDDNILQSKKYRHYTTEVCKDHVAFFNELKVVHYLHQGYSTQDK